MDREKVTEQVSNAISTVVFQGTSHIPLVKPDAAQVVRKINSITKNKLYVQEPADFFDAQLPIEVLDRAAKDYTRHAQLLVAGSGMTTGLVGLPGALPDMTVLISTTVGLVRRHALAYGFTEIEDNPDDKLPLLLGFAAATGAEAAIKQASILMARVAADVAMRVAAREAAQLVLARQISVVVAVQLVSQAGKKVIPIVGSITGGALNFAFLGALGHRSAGYWRERHMIIRQTSVST